MWMVVYTCNASAAEAEAGGSSCALDRQSSLTGDLWTDEKLCLKDRVDDSASKGTCHQAATLFGP